ncbi:2-oxo acid dehydrogenase subunit E2, partial [bacterium]|nr:2-oxo acid dehydrogenase subunit E2 [bacterium]
MATKDIQLPEIGEGVTEGELVRWLVKVGDSIKVDQSLVELMTDKATVEVPSPAAGVVKELKFKEGDVIKVGAAFVIVDDSGAGAAKPAPVAAAPAPTKAPATPAPMAKAPPTAMSMSSGNGGLASVQPPPMDVHVLATPSTRRLARENNVDINQIPGSGLAGRVTREDVLKSQGATGAGLPTYAPTMPNFISQQGKEEREPLRGVRKKIAENMQMAKHIVPHFTLMDEANVTSLVKMREELKSAAEQRGLKVTYLPFVMKALISTIREFPKFNSSI